MTWIAVSTARAILLVELSGRSVRVLEQGREEYYGVSWFPASGDLVLSHSGIDNEALVDLAGYLESRVGYVSQGLARSAGFLSQPHQILCLRDGRVLCTNTGRNALAVVDLGSGSVQEVWLGPGRWDRFDPSGKPGRHLNSVWLDGDVLHVVAHGHDFGSSVLRLSYPEFQLIDETPVRDATGLHNIVVLPEGRRIACHSFASGIIDVDSGETLWRVPPEQGAWYTRGLAVTQDVVVVGGSRQSTRALRRSSPSMVWVIDRASWRTLAAYDLGSFGGVHEVRVLDEPDLAHHGVPFAGLDRLRERSGPAHPLASVPFTSATAAPLPSGFSVPLGNPSFSEGWVTPAPESLTLLVRAEGVPGSRSWSFAYRLPDSSDGHASFVLYAGRGGDTHMDAFLLQRGDRYATLTQWAHAGSTWEVRRLLLSELPVEGALTIVRDDGSIVIRSEGGGQVRLRHDELAFPTGRVGMRLLNAQAQLADVP